MTNQAIKTINTLTVSDQTLPYQFKLPHHLECAEPSEERNIRRDEVRLMVSKAQSDQFEHSVFKSLGDFLDPGDLLVVNNSGTLKAAIEAYLPNGQSVHIHFSTRINEREWILELRKIDGNAAKRFQNSRKGDVLGLKHGGSLQLIEPYYQLKRDGHLKLWKAKIDLPISLEEYLDHYGKPIKYSNVQQPYPQAYYQTVFAKEMGSAEMPSAGRAFTPELVTTLISKGVQVAPITLHTGVASLEVDEKPYEEYFRLPAPTADLVNLTRKRGQRVIAVGTTVIRALESVADANGTLQAGEGWTDVFITPERGIWSADGLLTGFHEPRASHLLMLEAIAGREHLEKAYREALEKEYQWHEFGDLHLILP